MITYPVLDLTTPDPAHLIMGQHAAWLPRLQIKVPFQFGGRVQKYLHPQEASHPVETLAEELALLRWLAQRQMAPLIGDVVYFQTVISTHRGSRWVDPCGAYGYQMADANRLEPGYFHWGIETGIQFLRGTGMVQGSDGAWNDLLVPGRNNILNGYIIDVRRSWHDRLQFAQPTTTPSLPKYSESLDVLKADLHKDGAFPYRDRPLPYQDTWLERPGTPDATERVRVPLLPPHDSSDAWSVGDNWHRGERQVIERVRLLDINLYAGDSVLDLGCCTGGLLQYASRSARGWPAQGPLVGLDSQPEFIALAQRIARANQMNIHYQQADLSVNHKVPSSDHLALLHWLGATFNGGPDHLLVLSMEKHISEPSLWWWVDHLRATHTYLETNAIDEHDEATWHLWDGVKARHGQHVGFSRDRHVRALYRIDRSP